MKIDSSLGVLVNQEPPKAGEPLVRPGPGELAEPARGGEERASGDVVRLSDRSRLAARATELAQAAPEVRLDKVNDIRGRLNAGTYNVSGQVVAEALLRKSITEV